MKINSDFILKEMKDASGSSTYYAIAVGKTAENFKGMVKLNETAAFIWNKVAECLSEGDILNEIVNAYAVERSVAEADLKKILGELKSVSAVIE